MQEAELKVEQVAISELRPAEYNPRHWSEDARRNLEASLNEFGFVQPIVVNSAPNRRGIIVGGNFKLDIAKSKGLTTVPVVWVNIPDLVQEKRLNLRLNKNQGEFDFDLLADFDKELLSDVGFSGKEIDRIFDADEQDDFDGDKEVASIGEPTAKYGDLFELGRHRLMCGDASKLDDVKKLMGGGCPSRYGLHRSALQRRIRGQRQEHLQHNKKRRHERGGLQENADCLVRQLPGSNQA